MHAVSVIIPVYNAEVHIEKCVNSILNGSNELDIQIILVNDGSTDSSLEICEKLSNHYHNIQILNQNNYGAGAARNSGMKLANAEYIGFVDADDEVSYGYFKSMYEYGLEYDADIVMSNVEFITRNKKTFAFLPYEDKQIIKKEEILYDHLPQIIASKNEKNYEDTLVKAMWCRIFRRRLIDENSIKFTNDMNGQDFVFTINAVCKAEKIIINKSVHNIYHYEYTSSLSKSYSEDRYKRITQTEAIIKKILESNNAFCYCKDEYYQWRRRNVFYVLRLIVHKSELDMNKKITEIRGILVNNEVESLFKSVKNQLSLPHKILYKLIKEKRTVMLLIMIKLYGVIK